MFEAFYNLSDNPFRLTPDPKFCFRHPSHDRAYAYLQYALRLGEGFIMVTGRPGIGKTTLVQVFMGELELTKVVAARVASANAEATDLMRVVAYAYGIDVEGLDKPTILVRLKQFFIEQTQSGKRVLLIIDEAQGLPYPALEELRLLADLQMGSRPLLQLFLVGQEKLRDLMQEPAMEQFQQRVIGVCHLEPLCLADTRDYMEHRLRTADWKGDPELTGDALLAIYQFSKGVPRHINKICTRLLLDGFMEKKHELNRIDVLEVAEALRAERLAPLGGDQAAATGAVDTGLVPELEKGTLTLADLALRADPEQPPLDARPATPEAVAKVEEKTDVRYTKQTAANLEQTGPGPKAAQASSGMAYRRSGNDGQRISTWATPAYRTGEDTGVEIKFGAALQYVEPLLYRFHYLGKRACDRGGQARYVGRSAGDGGAGNNTDTGHHWGGSWQSSQRNARGSSGNCNDSSE
jgi:type II secretory pathway predicted ATPase ExeA